MEKIRTRIPLAVTIASLVLCARAGAQGWTQLNTDGFGNSGTIATGGSVELNGCFYVGAGNLTTGSQVWEYCNCGSDLTRVDAAPGGFGDGNNLGVSTLEVFGGSLYAATVNLVTGAEVWRWNGGTSWTRVNTDGFGDADNLEIVDMGVYSGALYAGTNNETLGGQVWRYNSGTSWTQVNTSGFGDSDNTEATGLIVYGGLLYAATTNDVSGCEVWRYNGTTWTLSVGGGFGNASNEEGRAMTLCGTSLYVGTFNFFGGCEVWCFDGTLPWTQVGSGGFGDSANEGIIGMTCYYGSIYAGTARDDGTGAQVWRHDGGTSWTQINTNGFGDDNNIVISYALNVYCLALWAGTENEITGAEVWRYDTYSTYCTAKTSSLGCIPFISATGAPSAADTNPFNVKGNDHLSGQGGVLVYGFGKTNLNFHGGKLCVKSPTRTAGKIAKTKAASGCTTVTSTGRLTTNFNNRIQGGFDPMLTVGQQVFAQWQQRDPANTIAGFTDNLSDGIRFTILP